MVRRLFPLLSIFFLLLIPATAKDKKKAVMPAGVLRAQTVRVVIDPDAGEPVDQPNANDMARDNVERALMEWGRYQPVMDGQESDLVIKIRTGNGRAMRPTIKGGPVDQRPGLGQTTDSSVRIGVQQGQAPPLNDPSMTPPGRGGSPRMSNEIGPTEDMFEVYLGGEQYPLDGSPVWRYVATDCLRAPKVTAVEEFRKAVAEAEKPQPQSKKP